jgi:hypothetical protein
MFKGEDWLILFKLKQAAYEEWKIVRKFHGHFSIAIQVANGVHVG